MAAALSLCLVFSLCICVVGSIAMPLGVLIISTEGPQLGVQPLGLRLGILLVLFIPFISERRWQTAVLVCGVAAMWTGWGGVLVSHVASDADPALRVSCLHWYLATSFPFACTSIAALAYAAVIWRRSRRG
jgi:hypothetical protein